MIVTKVDKRLQLSKFEIVKYQIATHCYLKSISVSDDDLNCIAHLALVKEAELARFCEAVALKGIFSCAQSVRNSITKSEEKKLIVKEGRNKKKISIHPELTVHTSGNIFLDYKFFNIEPEEV